jgi:hypothetical protein
MSRDVPRDKEQVREEEEGRGMCCFAEGGRRSKNQIKVIGFVETMFR